MEQYIYKGTKKLRCGYTTGSCAAAAAKAAAEMLLGGKDVALTELMTPSGRLLKLDIADRILSAEGASCAVRKDSGDDPDVTNGILVYASVKKTPSGIVIEGGEGVGRVTRPGLDRPVGSAAINSTPLEMITKAVEEIAAKYGYNGGFKIVISVPGGEEIAKKTFNPRIGIVGGISIIGTTGIVEPMSSTAIVDTIRVEANMQHSLGRKTLVLTVGNYSERFLAMNIPDLSEHCVMCSNFIGDALDIGVSLGFEKILLIGHIGKLVKLGSGIMNTHSHTADGRMETLIACGAIAGVPHDVLRILTDCITTDAALDILYQNAAAEQTLDVLIKRINEYMYLRVRNEVEVGAVVFSDKHSLLLKTPDADRILDSVIGG